MRPPLLAVSQRIDRVAGRDERRDALDQALSQWVMLLGCLPVPIPNSLGPKGMVKAWLEAVAPQGIILSGGNDLGSEPDRDETERAFLVAAEEQGIPVLGICRGMQMIAHWGGAQLKPVTGHVRTAHTLIPERDTADNLPNSVNSFHEFAVVDLPPSLNVLARSQGDGTIEAIRHASLPFEGWMWHPERDSVPSIIDLRRARVLFQLEPDQGRVE